MLASLGFWGKAPDPAEQIKEWTRGINKEIRHLDRDIRALAREEEKSKKECKQLAQKDKKAALIVAKSIVQARRAKEKMFMTKASLNTMVMQLKTQQAMVKAAGCLQKSTAVMKSLNDVMKLGKMSEELRDMAREMEKAGMIEEMLSEGLDEALGSEELDAEADSEVNKVIDEIVTQQFVGTDTPTQPVARADGAAAAAVAEDAPAEGEALGAEEDEELAAMRDRLQAL